MVNFGETSQQAFACCTNFSGVFIVYFEHVFAMVDPENEKTSDYLQKWAQHFSKCFSAQVILTQIRVI